MQKKIVDDKKKSNSSADAVIKEVYANKRKNTEWLFETSNQLSFVWFMNYIPHIAEADHEIYLHKLFLIVYHNATLTGTHKISIVLFLTI